MTMFGEDELVEVLDYLDVSLLKFNAGMRAEQRFLKEAKGSSDFYKAQYDSRLENLLRAKGIDIHHLESGIKNKIILRREELLKKIR